MKRHYQAIAADVISVAGHSLELHQTPIEDRCSRRYAAENSRTRKSYVRETLGCPCPGLFNASGVCPKPLLVSARLGEGAAMRPLRTHHQEEERERPSNHTVRLRAFRPVTPSQSRLYIRKESTNGSAQGEPVRPWAPSLPSAGTRSQSAGGHTPVPACAWSTRPGPICGRAP